MTSYVAPASRSGLLSTTDWKGFDASQVNTADPSSASTRTTVPAGTALENCRSRVACSEEADGVSTMPTLPAASRVPPETRNSPLMSMAPSREVVGPLITTVPPDMAATPLDSKPSPSASMMSVPPLTSAKRPSMGSSMGGPPARPGPPAPPTGLSDPLPSDTFSPSSSATTLVVPPLMTICVPSRPS